jgi:hypothetical protein
MKKKKEKEILNLASIMKRLWLLGLISSGWCIGVHTSKIHQQMLIALEGISMRKSVS